jgi:UDP-N-acetyl-D-mannosaminuronic acid dehydrogenase
VGGHCIAVDPWFVVSSAPQEARLIRTAREVNDHKPDWVVDKIKAKIAEVLASNPGKSIADVKVACLGLAFKPDIDDLRESPAVEIVEKISKLGCQVLAVEPNIEVLLGKLSHENVRLTPLDTALSEADVVGVLVKHRGFVDRQLEIQQHGKAIDAVGLLQRL